MTLTLSSTDFAPGEMIPVRFTCEGADQSPALTWGGMPDGTASFALIMDDPDAPRGPFTHWLLYNLSSHVRGLPQGVEKVDALSDSARQGMNDFNRVGYGGPCPPVGHGPHRYYFTLYALDTMLDLPPRASKSDLLQAMDGHILGQAQIMGRFERKQQRG